MEARHRKTDVLVMSARFCKTSCAEFFLRFIRLNRHLVFGNHNVEFNLGHLPAIFLRRPYAKWFLILYSLKQEFEL